MKLEYVPVSSFGTVITGKTPSTSKTEYWDGNIPFITPTDIKGYDMFYINETERYVSEKGLQSQKNTLLPKDSICVTCIGSTIGKLCIVKHNSITNQQINSVLPYEQFEPLYLYYVFRSSLKYIQMISGGTGSGTPIISKNKFEKLKYPVFTDIEYQKKVANVLSKYDELIEVNNKRIKILEQTAEELYKEWFVRFRFPGHETAQFENGIPKGWNTIKIKDITSLKSGYSFKSEWFSESGNCIAKIKDIGETIMNTGDFSYVEESNCLKAKKFILKEGDLTIALTGATIGKISIVPQFAKTIYTNQRLGKFFNGQKPIDKLPFLYCFFAQKEIVQEILNISNSSSAQPNISPEQIENIKICSNIEAINHFNTQTKNIFKQILILYYKNQNLIKQRDLLLPRLMSGKLEV